MYETTRRHIAGNHNLGIPCIEQISIWFQVSTGKQYSTLPHIMEISGCLQRVLLDEVLTSGLGEDLTPASTVSLRVAPPLLPVCAQICPVSRAPFITSLSTKQVVKMTTSYGQEWLHTHTHTHTHTYTYNIKYVQSVTERQVIVIRAPYLTKSTLHIMFSWKEATSKPRN